MKKIILTGSSGLIGKEAIIPLEEAEFQVFCPTSKELNLLDLASINSYLTKVQATHLLHFAWITGGDYLTNPINKELVSGSLEMLKVFHQNGGKRAVFAGTCFEYSFKETPLHEEDPLNPTTLYATCKCELREKAVNYAKEHALSFGWGRIFYVFGHDEKEGRLTSNLIKALQDSEQFSISSANLIRDYMYSQEIARAFVRFLDSTVEGSVNISTGQGISLGDYATIFAKFLKKEKYLILKNESSLQPPVIIGNNSRLRHEVKFEPSLDLDTFAKRIL